MAILFPSDAWIKALSAKLNESESYERSAKSWEGDFIFVIEPDVDFKDTAYMFLGLYHGKSLDAAMTESLEEREAQYILRAPYGTWLKVLAGKIDPIQGMMTRQLKLTGNMMMIMRYPKAAQEIMACTKLIPTEYAV